ncbi:MAG: urease accessory protein UreE, partial [Oricola sp.]|nr:urease accessory protein UreE [Oricola sp.]
RRIRMVSDGGIEFLLHLETSTLLRNGDGLVLEDGRIVKVISTPELLYAVRGRSRLHLQQLIWHVGNRHLASQIEEGRILIRRDRVIRAMLEGLGAKVEDVTEPFDPLGGAYSGAGLGHSHDHDHHHHHDHDHVHHDHHHGHTHD